MDKVVGGGYTGGGVLVTKKEGGLEWEGTKKYKEEIISVFHNPKRLL